MNGTSGFHEVRSSSPHHHRLAPCTSNGINSEQVPGTFSLFTILPLSRQASAQREKRFLTPFLLSPFPSQRENRFLTHFLRAILILVHFLLSAAICQAERPEPSEHLIQFSNSKEEKGILVDGTKDGTWVNDWSLLVPARENKVSIRNFTPSSSGSLASSAEGQIIAFSKGRVPVLKQHIQWQAKPKTVEIKFLNPIEIELAIWIVTTPEVTRNGRRADYEVRKKGILEFDCPVANDIWSREAHGLSIRCSPKDRTRETAKIIRSDGRPEDANKFFSDKAFKCVDHTELIKKVGYNPKAINVYYVTLVDAEQEGQGLGRAVWCDASPDIIAIGVTAVDETLAHELGHAFTLDHINDWASPGCDNTGSDSNRPCLFDEGNLMYKGGRARQYLTEGQVFRVFFNDDSALNSIYQVGPGTKVRPGEPRRLCETILKNDDDRNKCPKIEKRLWADGPTWPPQIK